MVLIDMEMPNRCDECRFMVAEHTRSFTTYSIFCTAAQEILMPVSYFQRPTIENRPDWCPMSQNTTANLMSTATVLI